MPSGVYQRSKSEVVRLRSQSSKFGFQKGHSSLKDNDSPYWKGETASYHTKHQWVEKWKGTPKKCEMCGTETARKYEWANIDHKYRRVLEDYIRMCTSCHRNYDIENGLTIISGHNQFTDKRLLNNKRKTKSKVKPLETKTEVQL